MKLFLSYNSRNLDFVKPVARKLQSMGHEVFFDKDSIGAGSLWLQAIKQGLDSSNAALVFLSEAGIGEWQAKEIIDIINKRSRTGGYRVIPVVMPGEDKLAYNMPWFLSDYQWVEFKDADNDLAYKKIQDGLGSAPSILAATAGKNPYRGLQSFNVEDDVFFFGRNYDLNLVFHTRLRFNYKIAGNNFLAVVADSGIGKSSFVKAGIMAALKSGQFEGSENWKQIILKPGSSPLSNLSAALKINGIIGDSRKFEENAKAHNDELQRTIRDQKDTWVIYIDQFEEVISQCKDETERAAFLNNISQAIECDRAIMLLSLRSDFCTRFGAYTMYKQLLETKMYFLPPLDIDNQSTNTDESSKSIQLLKEIITQPAKNAGVVIDDSLVELLINDVKQVRGTLPILQLALSLLWKNKANANTITLNDYALVSKNRNLAGIIQTHADKVFNDLTNNGTHAKKAELIKRIFVPNLVEISNSGDDVRRSAIKDEIVIPGYTQQEIETTIDELTNEDSRLLSTYKTDGQVYVEVVHEVIIRQWPLLKEWIDARRDALLFRERIIQDAADWNKGRGELYSGKQLKRAQDWLRKNGDLSNGLVENFIRVSGKLLKLTPLNSFIVGVLAIILGLLLYFYLYDPNQEEQAKTVFTNNLESVPSVWKELEKNNHNIDAVTKIELKQDEYRLVGNKLFYFKNLHDLYIESPDIYNLLGLKTAKDLTTLQLGSNPNLKSLDGIEETSNLKKLILAFNRNLSEIQNIASLKSLRSLNIVSNDSLKDLSSLSGLDSLVTLIIRSQQFRIFPNSGLPVLRQLSIRNLYLLNLKDLRSLKSLKNLQIANIRNLSNFSEISALPQLDTLVLSDVSWANNLDDVVKLASLKALEITSDTNLQNLHGIARLHLLKCLVLVANKRLNDWTDIKKLDSLKTLIIDQQQQAINMESLSKLITLESLAICNSALENLVGLENLRSLKNLTLTNTKIKKLDGVAGLTSLDSLTIKYNGKLINVSGIEKLKTLKYLSIWENPSLPTMQKLPHLDSLTTLVLGDDYGGNQYDLNTVGNLPNLKTLDIPYNYSKQPLAKFRKEHPNIILVFGPRNDDEKLIPPLSE